MDCKLAPCGVYCPACPSYEKTCGGCYSEKLKRGRVSKFSCKIRACCIARADIDYCFDCGEFPCSVYAKKLLATYSDDARYKYRFDLPELAEQFKNLGLQCFIERRAVFWKCSSCGGVLQFYSYICKNCGRYEFK